MAERAATLARRLVDNRRKRDALQDQLAVVKVDHDEAQAALWDRMLDDEDTTVTKNLGAGYGKVQFVRMEVPKAVVKDPARAVASIRDQHLEKALLDEAQGIRQKALTDDLKHRMRRGIPFIDGVDVHFVRYVTVTYKKEK